MRKRSIHIEELPSRYLKVLRDDLWKVEEYCPNIFRIPETRRVEEELHKYYNPNPRKYCILRDYYKQQLITICKRKAEWDTVHKYLSDHLCRDITEIIRGFLIPKLIINK